MIKNKSQKTTFATIGIMNTAIDFGILFLLKSFGLPTVPANIVSTSAAFCFSFFANKKYTFKTDNAHVKREFILFITVTLFGLWVLQTIVIAVMTGLLAGTLPDALVLFIAKLLAVVVSLIWNYTMYSRVVFERDTGAK